jgi:hypothetical protein
MRPRPSDDPVMNTRATLTPPHEPECSSCAPRVSFHSVRGTTQRPAFYGRTGRNLGPGHSKRPPLLIVALSD